MGDTIESYIELYGDPVLRFKPDRGILSEEQLAYGDIPHECAIFSINHVTRIMVVSRTSRENDWHANYGERSVILELLKRLREKDGKQLQRTKRIAKADTIQDEE